MHRSQQVWGRRGLSILALVSSLATMAVATPVPVHMTASVTPSTAHPGEVVTATVHVDIDPGWHVYSSTPPAVGGPSATAIVSLAQSTPASLTVEDTPLRKHDPNFDLDVAYHENKATFTRQFRIPASVGSSQPEGAASTLIVDAANLVFHYQTCNDKVCLPPTDTNLPISVAIERGPVRPEYANATAAPNPTVAQASLPAEPHTGTSLLLFLLAAIGAGLLALLTPCVFPLIPITLTSFVKQSDGDRRKLARLAVGYSAGIVALYLVVGAVATATLGASGAQTLAANPWVNLFLFALFVVFALSFFETITLQLPAALSGVQSTARQKSGVTGLLLMGVAAVLASFTCTAPFVGTLLVSAAAGDKLKPLLGMTAFALAFCAPYLVCAAFPSFIGKIPKSGVWLARVKATLGFVELVAALKFLSNADLVWQWRVLTQPVMLGLSAVILFCTFLYLVDLLRFGIVAETETERKPIPAARRTFAGLFLALTVYCFWGMTGRPISPIVGSFLPPAGYGGVAEAAAPGLPFLTDYAVALAQAKAEHKPLFIDFTGYTCTNCRLNEKNVFPRREVQKQFADFVRVQLYTDGGKDGASNQKLQQDKFGDVALPLYAVVDPSTEAPVDKIAGVVAPAAFESFLSNAKTKVAASPSGPVPPGLGVSGPTALAPWSAYDAAQIGKGTPVLIDFTAKWCVNCHAIEKQVFDDPAVKPMLAQKFVTMRADMTDWDGAPSQALRKQYGIDALPAVLVFDAQGNEVKTSRITGLLSIADFVKKVTPASS